MSTDATKRPLKIPVNYQNYAEEQGVFDLVSQMMESLLISKPADPLNFLIDFLHKDDHRVVKVAIIGPPGSGKSTIADSLAAATNSLVKNDLEEFCTESVDSKEGWVLDGFPRNRKEVLKLQEKGHLIDYVIVLYASEDALRQRMIDGDDSFTENFKEYTKNKEMVIKDHSKVL
jgi:adenylate kinase